MATVSDPSLRVLHALRLTSFAPVATVAAVAEVAPGETAELLEVFAGQGWAAHREGAISGWTLTPAGRAEDERLLAEELATAGVRAVVEQAYHRFLVLNRDCLQVCTDWQLVEGDGAPVVNEHTDPAYDASVIRRLRALDDAVQPICAELAAALARFASYGPRLTAAVDRVEAGDGDWFTKPTLDSFHTVWFQLHEDLLATLGIERGSEERSITTTAPIPVAGATGSRHEVP